MVIWTTTPWTLPGNRAISYSPKIPYGLYKVTDAAPDNWAKFGDLFILSENLAGEVFKQARVTAYDKIADVPAEDLADLGTAHPLRALGYDFTVPLLAGDHVTDDTGTGFVHTAPGHGREDFEVWTANARELEADGINPAIPYTVDENGALTAHAPGFTGKRVINDKGEKGDANDAVIKALAEAGNIIARGRLKHQYPHSWRSKKPVIYRNTPQWFIAMDKDIAGKGDTLRHRAMTAIAVTQWIPPAGENRITGMIESRPDWVISRQRAWGVPIAVFVKEKPDGSVEILNDAAVNTRIGDAFEQEGADAWYAEGAAARFLGSRATEGWKKVDDILDVWFDSGSTHAFVLEDPENFPQLAGIDAQAERRRRPGDVSRRLGPASRLVSVLAAGKLRHPRHRAVRHGADARLRARRARPQDVEVARQHGGAAGRDQEFRRRHSADVGLRVRLCRRSAHRRGNPQDQCRDLSQAAQHHPLDAGLARAFHATRIASRSTTCRSWSG